MLRLHPCGALPVSGVIVSIWYCHHHMAWWARVEHQRQDGDEVEVVRSEAAEFGPFDAYDDVMAWVRAELSFGVVSG